MYCFLSPKVTECRLAGTALIVPLVNYQWPSLPYSLIKEDYRRKFLNLGLWLSTYVPGLLHWWVTQNWIPSTSVLEKNPIFFNERDIDILKTIPGFPMLSKVKILSFSLAICVDLRRS